MILKSDKEFLMEDLEENLKLHYDKNRRFEVNFTNFDEGRKVLGERTYDILEIAFQVLEERIKQEKDSHDCYYTRGWEFVVRSMAFEVLKLAPYMSEKEIKDILTNNRTSIWGSFQQQINSKVEEKVIAKAEKNAEKRGFTIPKMKSLKMEDFDELIWGLTNRNG